MEDIVKRLRTQVTNRSKVAYDAADEIESLRAQLAEVTRKYEESVGGFKRDIQEKLDQQRTKNKRLETKILATQAHAARLAEALELASIGSCNCLTKTNDAKFHGEHCRYRIISEALSTPINLDALHEHDAQLLRGTAEK